MIIRRTVWMIAVVGMGLGITGCGDMALPGPLSNLTAQDEYTILLVTFKSSDHVSRALFYKDQVEKTCQWEDLYIVHKQGQSELYWGKYRTQDAAKNNWRTAKQIKTSNVGLLFPRAMIVPIAGKEMGPPEYDLSNAKGYWTVLVAIFTDDPKSNVVGRKRMKAAVEYCKWLRDRGFEAYYSHNLGRSQVTVGSFPDSAITLDDSETKTQKRVVKQVIRDPEMRRILTLNDPPLKYLAVNGFQAIKRVPTSEGKVTLVTRSRPIAIPRKDANH